MVMVKRNGLLKCLAAVGAGLSPKDDIEQSSCYVLQKGRMRTFNDNIACSFALPDGMENMECAIPAEEFRNLLTKLNEDDLDISLGGEGVNRSEDQLLLKMKRRRAGIRVQLSVSLPVGEMETPEEWVSIPEGFADAVETVGQVAGKGEELFVLCCVHITPKGFEACDNYQAIRYRLPTGLSRSVLVKRDYLIEIAKLKVEQWALSKSWLHFRNSSGLDMSCRRWDQSYPDLGPSLKVEGCEGVLPKGLCEAIGRAEVFINARDDSIGLTIDLDSSRLLLRAKGMVGWYEESQKVDYSGKPISFRIAPRLLREVCRRTSNCVIGDWKLKVVGEKYVYVSCLAVSGSGEES